MISLTVRSNLKPRFEKQLLFVEQIRQWIVVSVTTNKKDKYFCLPIDFLWSIHSCHFCFQSWDERRYVLSAVTAGIRSNWMTAIRRAAGLPEPIDISLTLGEKLERELERSSAESNNPQYYETKHSSSRTSYLESCESYSKILFFSVFLKKKIFLKKEQCNCTGYIDGRVQ